MYIHSQDIIFIIKTTLGKLHAFMCASMHGCPIVTQKVGKTDTGWEKRRDR